MKKKTIKWILGIIGIIFLGAVGSGLWQIGIEPVGSWLLETSFKVTTLGLSTLSDTFYQSVAKGLHEEPSLVVLLLVTSIFISFFAGLLGRIQGKRERKLAEKELKGIDNRIEQYEKSTDNDASVLKQKAKNEYNEYTEKLNRRRRRRIRIVIFLGVLLSSFILFQVITIINRNSAITKFRQAFTIGKPMLTEEKEEEILSKFSMIKNKQDYLNVINMLKEKANKESQDLNSSNVKDKPK